MIGAIHPQKSRPIATYLLENAVVRNGLLDHRAEILGLEAGQVNECAAIHEMLLERSNCLVLPTETEITTDALVATETITFVDWPETGIWDMTD